jgi:hypothetical protein
VINFADVSDLVADRRDLVDSSKESLFRVLAFAEATTGLLLDVWLEQEAR